MGSTISVNPETINQHGEDVKGPIKEALNKARDVLNTKGTIEGGDFSITGTLASMGYPMGLQFAYEDLETHLEMLEGYGKNLVTAAKNYSGAEQASKITEA